MKVAPEEIDRRIEALEDWYTDCTICPQMCGVDRFHGPFGHCGLSTEGRVYKEFIHLGEEPEVSPTHIIYLAGCNFRCRYCSDFPQVIAPESVETTDPKWITERIARRRKEGAKTVTFVGGSPDVQPLFILRALRDAPTDTRVVWNSNLWMEPECLELLFGVVDLFIPDVKYGYGRCDQRLSGVEESLDQILDSLGLMKGEGQEVIARHLLVPGHQECCTEPVLEALSELWPGLRVNLMTAYRPFNLEGQKEELGRKIASAEVEERMSRVREIFSDKLDLRRDGQPL
jgi:putative pyruvate formate lyase activating enzyme